MGHCLTADGDYCNEEKEGDDQRHLEIASQSTELFLELDLSND